MIYVWIVVKKSWRKNRIGELVSFNLVQFRSKTVLKEAFSFNFVQFSFNFRSIFVQRRSKGLWSVDQAVSGRSTISPLNGRPEDLIKTDHRTVKEKS